MKLDQTLMDYRRHLVARGLSVKTTKQYVKHLEFFFELNGLTSMDQIVFNTQTAYHEYLETLMTNLRGKDLSKSAINGYLCALDRFFSWQIYMNGLTVNPIPFYRDNCVYFYKQKPPKQAYVPTMTEMVRFLDSIDNETIRAMVAIGCKTMLRKDEILTTKIKNIDLDRRTLIVTDHAKRSNCLVFLDGECVRLIRELLEERRDTCPYLFCRKPGQPYQRTTARNDLMHFAVKAGLYTADGPREYNLTWNSCRRFGVTRLKEAGMDPDYIAWLRGDNLFRSSDMTIRYRQFDINTIQKAYDEYIFKFWP